VQPLRDLVPDWKAFLESGLTPAEIQRIEQHGRTGRPLGTGTFVADVEQRVGRTLVPGKPGPKPRGLQEN
jgi:putative transposase